jgi:hypothetical protein
MPILIEVLGFLEHKITFNIFKQDISYQLDEGFRLVCKMSKIFLDFLGKAPFIVKMDQNFFSHPYMTIYTPIESPHQVDTRYAVFKVTQSDYVKRNKIVYTFGIHSIHSKFVYAQKNVHFCILKYTMWQPCCRIILKSPSIKCKNDPTVIPPKNTKIHPKNTKSTQNLQKSP